MKSKDIDSPNQADSIMMCLYKPVVKAVHKPLKYNKVCLA